MRYLLLLLCLPLMGQTPDYGRTAQAGALYDFTAAARTMPVKAGLSSATPATCTASKELYVKTDATAGQQLFICNATGNGFVLVGDGGAGGGLGYALTLRGLNTPACGGTIHFGLSQISGQSGATETDVWKVQIPKTGTIKTVTFDLYQSTVVSAPTATGTLAVLLGPTAGTATVLSTTDTWPVQYGGMHSIYTALSIAVTAGQLVSGRVVASGCTSGSYTFSAAMTLYIE